MEIGSQIKKYRIQCHLSQDELAQKVYVSRQSISNWETNKTYPDIQSLLLLSEVFSISLDLLIKGDIEMMKKEIDKQELHQFQNESTIFTILFIALLILPAPLVVFFKWWGMTFYLIIFIVALYYANHLEKHKKKYDIQTYKEIIAFYDGQDLSEIEKSREEGKRPYQKIFLSVASALLVVIIALIMTWILK